jgi:hypothetical protein
MFLFIFLVISIIAGGGTYLILLDETLVIKDKDVESTPLGMAIAIGDGIFACAYLVYVCVSWMI